MSTFPTFALTGPYNNTAGATAIVNCPPTGGSSSTYCGGDGAWHSPSASAVRGFSGYCSGTATSSQTLSIFGLGTATFTCTATSAAQVSSFMVPAGGGTLSNLSVRCGTTGVNASSGVFTVYRFDTSGATHALTSTVTYGTATANSLVVDSTHTDALTAGDLVYVRFTTQATETLANCDVGFNY
jgi:hypothetical protein